jgi:S-methylmethionine-dependent homocysteine/selenocysteine methylase
MALTTERVRRQLGRVPRVLDGATGTELERRGIRAALPLWSAAALDSAPDVVTAIHREYIEAGADIIVANTFRTNVRTLARAGRTADGPRLNQLAVALARQAVANATAPAQPAAGRRILVAASVAPVEDCYCPQRVPATATLQAEHRQMMAWLQAAGPDLIWIETMTTSREARAAAEAAATLTLPFVLSFTTQETGELLGGEPLADAVAAVTAFGPLAIGVNCIPPRGLTTLLPRLRQLTTLPLAAYAHVNNAAPIPGWTYGQMMDADEYGRTARSWLNLGAAIVGGCCGTTPEHIRAIRHQSG